ncbi:MAG: ribbon-helix-helix domain-containing protein [Candidatus Aenigmarchaeota archaeon]|nr:ribbon-helix-helix domain-containing protein [Candidatus Aenigmarchaeota archaeon]
MKTKVVNFRATEQLIKDLEEIIKADGHYRNKTEVINEALRKFIRGYWRRNINVNMRKKR